MENIDVIHHDALKLTRDSLRHSLEKKAKCQMMTGDYNYNSNKMRDLIDELRDLLHEMPNSSKQESLEVTEAREAVTEQLNDNQIIHVGLTYKFSAEISHVGTRSQRIEETRDNGTDSFDCCRDLDGASFQTNDNNKKNGKCRIEDRVVTKTTPQLKPPIPIKGVICGLDTLNGELYVADYSDIEVFDADTRKSIRKFPVKGLAQVRDIKACVKHNCLYVMDGSNGLRNEIFVIDINGQVLSKWTVENYGHLSITEEGTVILAVYVDAKIAEYSHDGHLIQEVCLTTAGVQELCHAVKLKCENFVISYKHRSTYFTDAIGVTDKELNVPNRSGISIVDSSGIIIKEFRNLQLHYPIYLDVDKHGFIVVADCDAGRVVLLNSDLQYQRDIVTYLDGVETPTDISRCTTTGQLFVADNSYRHFSRFWAIDVSETI